MKTTKIKKITINGVDMIATSDGQVIRMKKTKNMNNLITNGTNNGYGYMRVRVGDRKFGIHRIIAKAFLADWDKSLQVDHIDGNPSNNRLGNLRMVSKTQNLQAYQSKPSGCSSRYRGVSWHKLIGKWVANITPNGKRKNLGYFADEIEAARAYDAAAESIGFDIQALNRTHHKEMV